MLNEVSNSNGLILRYIEEHEDEMVTQKDIEMAFGITRSTASTVLSLMEKKELITREVLKEDNRVKKVLITDKGKSVNADIKKEIDDFEANLTQVLKAHYRDADIDVLKTALNYMSEASRCYTPSSADQYGAFRVGPSYPFNMI